MGENQRIPKWSSPNGMIQNSKSKINSTENKQRKEGKNQAVTMLLGRLAKSVIVVGIDIGLSAW